MFCSRTFSFACTLVLFGPAFAQDQETHGTKVPRPPVVQPDVKWPVNTSVQDIEPGVWRAPAAPAAPGMVAPKTAEQPAAVDGRLARLIADPAVLVFDRPGDGALWAGSALYKVRFDRTGAAFIPFLGSDAPDSYPVHFALREVTVGGQPIEFTGSVDADLAGHRVTFDRGAVTEHYDIRFRDMEQLFVIDDPDLRGAIDVRIDVTTDLAFAEAPAGFQFRNQHGRVTYGRAVAIDATGERLDLESDWDGSSIGIHVPSWFVAGAVFPITIDPVVGGVQDVDGGITGTVINPDVTYDASNNRTFYVFERIFSATDHDIFGGEFDLAGSPIAGSLITVDFTTNCWEKPKTANNSIGNRYLTVAQVSTSCGPPFRIEGRTRNAGGTTQGAQFTIADASLAGHFVGDKINPDVGGDPHPTPPTYFTVVWERVFPVGVDNDIHLKQTTNALNPALRSASPTLIDNAGSFESNPAISNTCGVPPAPAQDFGVVYQRTAGAGNENIRAAMVHWDGGITAPNFLVNGAPTNDRNPTASSLTLTYAGNRFLLFAYDRVIGGQSDIVGTVVDRTGVVRTTANLTALEVASPPASATWPQLRPSADTDFCGFTVAYEELWTGAGGDWDIRTSSFAYSPVLNAINVDESRAWPASSGSAERTAEIASRFSTGENSHVYAIAQRDDRGAADDEIEGRFFVNTGVFNSVSTGCGGLSLSTSGDPRTDASFAISMTVAGPANNGILMFGFPDATPGPICSTCELGIDVSIAHSFVDNGILTDSIVFNAGDIDVFFCGFELAVQGFAFQAGAGSCGPFSMTDTVKFTLH